jgi:predicted RNase H-like nuclease (RuvC/YqgF family)
MRKLLIAGLDAGLNTGLAVIDLDGNLVCLDTLKSPALSETAKMLLDQGCIIAVSTDKKDPPRAVKKIASSISADLVCPLRNLTKKKKRLLIEDMFSGRKSKDLMKFGNRRGSEYLSSHEKSALASAIYAYRKYTPMLKKLRDKIKDNDEYIRLRDRFLTEKGIRISDFVRKAEE